MTINNEWQIKPLFVTVKQAAGMLGVSHKTVCLGNSRFLLRSAPDVPGTLPGMFPRTLVAAINGSILICKNPSKQASIRVFEKFFPKLVRNPKPIAMGILVSP